MPVICPTLYITMNTKPKLWNFCFFHICFLSLRLDYASQYNHRSYTILPKKGFFFFWWDTIKAIKYCMEKSSLIVPKDTFGKSLI